MKKIDRIYINTPHSLRVIILFEDGTRYESQIWESIKEACDYKDSMLQKYGYTQSRETRFQEWANFSEDKHPMKK